MMMAAIAAVGMTLVSCSSDNESLKYATGIIARLYLEQLHEVGQIDDEQYKKLHTK